MSLTREDVARVALLSRLELTADELTQMTDQLTQILSYIDQLNELETDEVEPLAHAIELTNVFAADEVSASLTQDEALANAPKRDSECYRVPAVLGE